MQYVNERIKQREKIIIANKYSAFVCDLIFYCFHAAREELWNIFLPTVVLSLSVIFQEYLHQLLTCIKVIIAQCDMCNTWTCVEQFILNPGNNLLHAALNEVLHVPFSEKEINGTGDYESSLAGHICCYHFFHYQSFLSPLQHSLLRNIHAVQNQIRNPLRTRLYSSYICPAPDPARMLDHSYGK